MFVYLIELVTGMCVLGRVDHGYACFARSASDERNLLAASYSFVCDILMSACVV